MSDYALTAGQQQQIIDFLEDGKSVYLEGNDFGYYHKSHQVYKMFGCSFLGDHDPIVTLNGVRQTVMENESIGYSMAGYPGDYVDWIGANGGEICLKSEEGYGRLVAYAGPDGTYRTIHLSCWFGALKNSGAVYTKAELMACMMNYLKGDTLLPGLAPNMSVTMGGKINLFLEQPVAQGGRLYGVLGTISGTSPGFPAGSVIVPINFDVFTQVVILFWNTDIFKNFQSLLDAQGRAQAIINYGGTLDPGLIGLSMDYAYILANPIDVTSNAVTVPIVP
jgi:hypothetical protein